MIWQMFSTAVIVPFLLFAIAILYGFIHGLFDGMRQPIRPRLRVFHGPDQPCIRFPSKHSQRG